MIHTDGTPTICSPETAEAERQEAAAWLRHPSVADVETDSSYQAGFANGYAAGLSDAAKDHAS